MDHPNKPNYSKANLFVFENNFGQVKREHFRSFVCYILSEEVEHVIIISDKSSYLHVFYMFSFI